MRLLAMSPPQCACVSRHLTAELTGVQGLIHISVCVNSAQWAAYETLQEYQYVAVEYR